MASHYELKSAANGQFMFNLKAGNGEIILTSESYKSKESALNGIESMKNNAADDAQYERKKAISSQPFFVLKAKNHEVIGRSEMYSSDGAMEKGIESVKKNGPAATTNDISR
ncbi:MAG: YegP family protein [Acidobacteria bacterium]|nr:YegP family protein [Acidobacteriota bacterium]